MYSGQELRAEVRVRVREGGQKYFSSFYGPQNDQSHVAQANRDVFFNPYFLIRQRKQPEFEVIKQSGELTKEEPAHDRSSNHAAAALMRQLRWCEGLAQIRLPQTAVHEPGDSGGETSASTHSINLCRVFFFSACVFLKLKKKTKKQADAEKVAN